MPTQGRTALTRSTRSGSLRALRGLRSYSTSNNSLCTAGSAAASLKQAFGEREGLLEILGTLPGCSGIGEIGGCG